MSAPHSEDNDTLASEQAPLLEQAIEPYRSNTSVSKIVRRRLYISHFLSTWNSRVFEFGAILYLATIFPGTLLPMSIYAFTRGLSAIIFAPAIGQYIDIGNRLKVVRISIVVQRLVVAASCIIFYILCTKRVSIERGGTIGLLVLLAVLACFEKLYSIMNLVSVEKDWVVVLAEGDEEALKTLNVQMRRIDLLCKLLGPLFIALIDGISTELAIIVNFAMNMTSIIVEYYTVARVYHETPTLQQPKKSNISNTMMTNPAVETNSEDSDAPESRLIHNINHVRKVLKNYVSDFRLYFAHQAMLPSVGGALLYLTVLNFAGQMVTYLLSAGYTSTQIGIARTFSVAFEILATWVAPWLMGKIGPVRAGLWLSSWQTTSLITGVAVFWNFFERSPLLSASGLVVGTIISRVGLRGFDLCTQLIVQEDVEAESRGTFSSVEAALQNAFELLSYASTMAFYRPKQFKYPALISVSAVVVASFVFSQFVRRRRGHLLHLEKILLCGQTKGELRRRGIESGRIM